MTQRKPLTLVSLDPVLMSATMNPTVLWIAWYIISKHTGKKTQGIPPRQQSDFRQSWGMRRFAS